MAIKISTNRFFKKLTLLMLILTTFFSVNAQDVIFSNPTSSTHWVQGETVTIEITNNLAQDIDLDILEIIGDGVNEFLTITNNNNLSPGTHTIYTLFVDPSIYTAGNNYFTRTNWTVGSNQPISIQSEVFSVVSTININEKQNNFSLLPNPTKGIIKIDCKDKIKSINIYNLIGQLIIKNNYSFINKQIDLKNLNNGIYFISLTTENNEVFLSKIVKI